MAQATAAMATGLAVHAYTINHVPVHAYTLHLQPGPWQEHAEEMAQATAAMARDLADARRTHLEVNTAHL